MFHPFPTARFWTRTRVWAIAVATIAGLGLAGLTGQPASAQDAQPFAISLRNGVVSPTELEVPANATVRVTVTNDGDAAAEFESKPLHIEKPLAAGASVTVTLRNLSPGSYEFVDEFTEDRATAHGVIIAR